MAKNVRSKIQIELLSDEEELKKRGYELGLTLGEGSYAKVKFAISEKLEKNVAIKIIDRKKAPVDFQFKFLPRELSVMRKISHPHIVTLYEIFEMNKKVCIVMELAGHGDLLEYIKLRGSVPENRAKYMFRQLVDAVGYLHGMNIIHRDLKCENILLDEANDVKLSDFGFSREIRKGELIKTFCGSAAYAAPEILMGHPYKGQGYDVWSMGVILFCMVVGFMPFDDSNIKKMIKYQMQKKITFPKRKKVPKDFKELVYSMLEPSTKERATVESIKKSDWLKSTKDDNIK